MGTLTYAEAGSRCARGTRRLILWVTSLVLAAYAGGCASQPAQGSLVGPNCDPLRYAASARKTSVHAMLLYEYPRKIPLGYSGCHSFWAEADGAPLWQVTVLYQDGHPKLYLSRKSDGRLLRETWCRYENGKEIEHWDVGSGAEQRCPSVDSFVKPEP